MNEFYKFQQEDFWCDGRTFHDGLTWYGFHFGCLDGADEGPACKQYDCLPGYWKCSDGLQCIRNSHRCDGKTWKDSNHNVRGISADDIDNMLGCFDRSDEHNMFCGCKPDEWPCADGQVCLVSLCYFKGFPCR